MVYGESASAHSQPNTYSLPCPSLRIEWIRDTDSFDNFDSWRRAMDIKSKQTVQMTVDRVAMRTVWHS